MPLIIDTFNVLHVTGVLPPDLAGLDVGGLARLIAASRYRHQRTTLVCDGVAPREASGEPLPGASFTVMHSGAHVSADDLIGRLVARSSAPRRLIVVSTDRAVAGNARRAGCRVLRSDAFLAQLVDDAESPRRKRTDRPSGVAARHVDTWMRVFGLDEMPIEEALPEPPEVPPTPARTAGPSPAPAPDGAAEPAPSPPPGTDLPDEIVAEAERLWEQQTGPRPSDEETDR